MDQHYMDQHLHIFQRSPEGSVDWVGSVTTMDEAKERIMKLAASNGHIEYRVYDGMVEKYVWPEPDGYPATTEPSGS